MGHLSQRRYPWDTHEKIDIQRTLIIIGHLHKIDIQGTPIIRETSIGHLYNRDIYGTHNIREKSMRHLCSARYP